MKAGAHSIKLAKFQVLVNCIPQAPDSSIKFRFAGTGPGIRKILNHIHGFRAFRPKKVHRTLPNFTQSGFRALLSHKRAQDSARFTAAGHPGFSLDLGSRGWGGRKISQIPAILANSCVFP